MTAEALKAQTRAISGLRILVVDDSATFRTQIRHALTGMNHVSMIDTAPNGKIALQKLAKHDFDLMTLDINMPELGGLETLKALVDMHQKPKILVFASQTSSSPNETFDALQLGAWDFILKPDGNTLSVDHALQQVQEQLKPRVEALINEWNITSNHTLLKSMDSQVKSTSYVTGHEPFKKVNIQQCQPMAIVIASSTGGPAALDELLSHFKRPPRIPILIAQHMPENFTQHLASRLSLSSGLNIREAIHGEPVPTETIVICPGNFHMRVISTKKGNLIHLDQGPRLHSVRPAADHLFQSAVQVYGKHTMGFILTGMGEDGAKGAESIKKVGGAVILQDQSSSVVWGMPAAAAELGAYDHIATIEECSHLIAATATK